MWLTYWGQGLVKTVRKTHAVLDYQPRPHTHTLSAEEFRPPKRFVCLERSTSNLLRAKGYVDHKNIDEMEYGLVSTMISDKHNQLVLVTRPKS